PLSRLLTRVSPSLDRLGALSPDRSAHREDEPYRRALTGIFARLAATASTLGLRREHRSAVGEAEPYADAAAFAADLDVIDRALREANDDLLADGRLRRLRKAVRIFGFHLASVDLRQNSEVHETVVAELLRNAGVVADYSALREDARRSVLMAELESPRLLGTTIAEYS